MTRAWQGQGDQGLRQLVMKVWEIHQATENRRMSKGEGKVEWVLEKGKDEHLR